MTKSKSCSNSSIEFTCVTKNIVLLIMDTQLELASTMVRFQEYYESPFPEIRDNIFTLGMLRKIYSESGERSEQTGGFSYYSDFNGFNFPGTSLQPFNKGLFDPLSANEQAVVDHFKYREDDFYVIGVNREQGEEGELLETFEHEVAHGMYTTQPKYREEVNIVLKGLGPEKAKMADLLIHWGYADLEHIILDEIHAYLCCNFDWFNKKYLDEANKRNFNFKKLKVIHQQLSKLFKKHYKPLNKTFKIK